MSMLVNARWARDVLLRECIRRVFLSAFTSWKSPLPPKVASPKYVLSLNVAPLKVALPMKTAQLKIVLSLNVASVKSELLLNVVP
ncbi:MAG: hypothetical protein Q7U56_05585, partial [Humidesulfovibrio sp.]|nr:hypothetical protein [Humidesulfovibrio sp.]